jgi:hypothetical protein
MALKAKRKTEALRAARQGLGAFPDDVVRSTLFPCSSGITLLNGCLKELWRFVAELSDRSNHHRQAIAGYLRLLHLEPFSHSVSMQAPNFAVGLTRLHL